MNIRITPPVWVVIDAEKRRVGILWDVKKQLIVLYRPDGTVALQGEGLEVQENLKVTGVFLNVATNQCRTERTVCSCLSTGDLS